MSYQTKQHPTIGPIRGLNKVPTVVQYLGVQYATLKDRFSRGVLLETYNRDYLNEDGVLDATKLGCVGDDLSPYGQLINIYVGQFPRVLQMDVHGSKIYFSTRCLSQITHSPTRSV